MQHPTYRLHPNRRKAVFYWGLLASLLIGTLLLTAIELGSGMLELARLTLSGSTTKANTVLANWNESDRLFISFANGFDYLFGMITFSTLAVGCAWVGDFNGRPTAAYGSFLTWMASLGILLDIPENAAYLIMVLGNTQTPWPQIAAASCSARVIIFVLCSAFIFQGLRKYIWNKT